MDERTKININSKILLPNTTIFLIFDRNSWVFAVRIQGFMKNEQESPNNLTEKGYIRILKLKFCIVASMKMVMVVLLISDDEAIMKGNTLMMLESYLKFVARLFGFYNFLD
jgi:hypothetical protein